MDEGKYAALNRAFSRPTRWPLIIATVGGLDYGFFAWSTEFVDTAIVSTVYELWPVVLIYLLIRDHRQSQNRQSQNKTTKAISTEQLLLSLLAIVGLMLMLASQSDDTILRSFDSPRTAVGIILALISAVLGAFSTFGGLLYGKRLFDSYFEREALDNNVSDRKILMYFTLIGFAITSVASSIISVGIRSFLPETTETANASVGITSFAIAGSITLGIIIGIASILLRYGNVNVSRPGVNALFFMSPALALLWLSRFGIIIPRTDLFTVGAALILTINVLIQWKPDEERDLIRFSKAAVAGVRLGFTAFIMSIWFFGAVLLLRDEIMPSSWLIYSTDEYWGLTALSATVFALILGFRMARLSTRINKEDETMFSLFRDTEHLIRRDILSSTIKSKLANLDTSKPKDLLKNYNDIREELRLGRAAVQSTEDTALLLSIEKQLDTIAHSKQQGRDIVELLSLTAFAVVTIGLGLLARPKGLELNIYNASWSGFLSEVFILLFVSTIAFLCINLFDIRRERETPLLVRETPPLVASMKERDYGYQLFFRHKQNLKVQHTAAVLISIAMSTTFSILLYNKWMP